HSSAARAGPTWWSWTTRRSCAPCATSCAGSSASRPTRCSCASIAIVARCRSTPSAISTGSTPSRRASRRCPASRWPARRTAVPAPRMAPAGAHPRRTRGWGAWAVAEAVTIREFALADAAAVAALWQRVFHDDSPWRAPHAIFERRSRRQGELFLVATIDGAVVATTMAGYDGHRGWLYRVAVAPEHQRRGLGRALVREAEQRLGQLGCPKVNLQIEVENRDVVGFYERLGWTVEDRVSMGKALATAPHRPRGATEIGVYLPQVGFAWHELRARVQLCDREGGDSIWVMGHLYPPGLPSVPAFEGVAAA